ncbi:MAG: extracellular solute-binding protein, partial [Phyllobacteriaceae bacterium]|nr:extracellular solute-binding protein [Phyllobacteriaceae bacterium]
MKSIVKGVLGAFAFAALATTAMAETTLTIATVNNGDMIRMQGLTDDFTSKNPDIKLNWVTLEENDLRQKVTTDISTKGGQYDVLTIGAAVMGVIFLVRTVVVYLARVEGARTVSLVAPRGLITILLAYNIPDHLRI